MSSKVTLSMSVVGGVVGGIVGSAVYEAWRERRGARGGGDHVSPNGTSASPSGSTSSSSASSSGSPRHLAIGPDVQRAPRDSATDMTEVVSPADLTGASPTLRYCYMLIDRCFNAAHDLTDKSAHATRSELTAGFLVESVGITPIPGIKTSRVVL